MAKGRRVERLHAGRLAVIALLVALGTTGCGDDGASSTADGGRSENPVRDGDFADDGGRGDGGRGDGGLDEGGVSASCDDDGDCGDGQDCTADRCVRGTCEFTEDDSLCDDDNPCTVGQCDSNEGCSFEDVGNGSTCRSQADVPGTCQDGSCVVGCETDADCDDGVACTADRCDPVTATCDAPVPDDTVCDDGNGCTTHVCDLTAGCTETTLDNGTACSDVGDAEGVCLAGACVTDCQTQADCDDGIPCTTDACNSDTGECVNTPNNGACLDGLSCTTDVCDPAAGCQAVPDDSVCNDGLPCTTDVCDPTSGCSSTPDNAACDDGVACTADACDGVNGCVNTPDVASCNDNNDCTAESCDAALGCRTSNVAPGTTCRNAAGAQGSCQSGACVVNCVRDADCDDNNACNGTETCDSSGTGTCQPGLAPNCDDGIACTTDTCDPFGGCQSVGDDNACDDGIACTDDTCSTTSGCGSAPENSRCDDGNPCTANACDIASDCVTTALPDGIVCTNMAGDNGLCEAGNCAVLCTQDSDCADGDLCNGTETCNLSNGRCQPGAPPACDDGISCTEDRCESATGCVYAAVDSRCDDGNDCTANSCDANAGCGETMVSNGTLCSNGNGQCNAGTCIIGCVSDGDCDDGAACTTDTCNLTNGQCENPPNDLACDDGVGCTLDVCAPGAVGTDAASGCRQDPDAASCDDGNPCTANACDATSDCQSTPITDGTPCTGAGGAAGACNGGTCVSQCTTDGDCDDGNVCNGAESCDSNGQCQGGLALNCDDSIDCTDDTCDAATGCNNSPIDSGCDDGIACTTDRCSASSGCANAPDASACDDSNPCTADLCDASSDCQTSAVVDGTLCRDSNGDNGLCVSGSCTVLCTTDADCADADVCNGDESCNTGTGRCRPGSSPLCDDGIDCTADTCDATQGCQYAPSDAACDDGVGCTTDQCAAASGCLNTPDAMACDDGNDCTAELCDANSDCQSSNVDDGTACGSGGTCAGGQCSNQRLLRIDAMRLEDPHVIADYRPLLGDDLCADVTNDDLAGNTQTALNPALDAAYASDTDGNGLIDQGLVLRFGNLDQRDGESGTFDVVQSTCFSADGSCVAGVVDGTLDYTVKRSGTCTLPAAGNLDGRSWPGPTDPVAMLNQPSAGADGCFLTSNSESAGDGQTLLVRINYLGAVLTLPLQDASMAGTFDGLPATGLSKGVIAGFLTEQDADIDLLLLSPGLLIVNLADDLLPDGNTGPACMAAGLTVPDGRDTHPQLGQGWWVFLDTAASEVTTGTGY